MSAVQFFQSRWGYLAFVFVVAVVVRLALMPHDVVPRLGSDQDEYDTYAWNLAQGRGYRGPTPAYRDREHLTSYRMPGPSLVFAAAYRVVGHKPLAAVVVNILLSAATCIPLFFIAREVDQELTARLAVLIWAFWPHAIFLCTTILSEALYTFLFSMFVWHALVLARRPHFGNILLNGLLLGALLYARPHALLLPFVLAWIVLLFWPDWRRILACCLIFVVAGIMLLPWVIRNYRVHSAFVLFSTQGGEALLQGSNRIVATDPKWFGLPYEDSGNPDYRDQFKGLTEVQRDKLGRQLYQQWMRENPDKWLYLVRNKFLHFWTPILNQPSRLNRMVILLSWGPVLLLFIPSFVTTLAAYTRHRDGRLMLHGAILSTMVTALIFSGLLRYRFPIEGFCIILACVSAVRLWRFCRKRSIGIAISPATP